MMTVVGTATPLIDICHNTMIIIRRGIKEMLTRKVTPEKGPILPSAMEKITETGITTNKTAGEFLEQFEICTEFLLCFCTYACRKHRTVFSE